MAGIEIDKIVIMGGNDDVLSYGDETANDLHCGICGSLLYSVVRDGAYAHVTFGTLLEAPRIRPQMHIFVGSKASWYDIDDDLPQFEALP